MHANNEIGNLLKLKEVGDICAKYGAVFIQIQYKLWDITLWI